MKNRRVALIFGGLLVASSAASAQDSTAEIARRDLIHRAEQANTAGNHADALALGLQAGGIRMTPSLRLMIGQQHRALGHLIDALFQATECAREAEGDATLRHRARAIEMCRGLATQIEPSLGRLSIQVSPQAAPGLQVHIGDAELSRALLGVAAPILPGHLSVRIAATGFDPVTRDVDLVAGHSETLTVQLMPTPAPSPVIPVPVAAPVVTAIVEPPPPPVAAPVIRVSTAPSGTHRALGWTALATGVAGLGLGLGGIVYRGAGVDGYNGSPACPGRNYGGVQPGECQTLLDQISTGSTMQWAGLIGGAALTVTGIIVLATAPTAIRSSSASVLCGPGALGLEVNCVGRF